jgi:hypothetical protein
MIIKFKQKDKWHSLISVMPKAKETLEVIVRKLLDNKFGSYVFKQSKMQYQIRAKEKTVVTITVIKDEQNNSYLELIFKNAMNTVKVNTIGDFNNAINQWYEEFIKNPTLKSGTQKGYIRKGVYSIEEILSKRNDLRHDEDSVEFDGDMIHMNSDRYHTFATSGTKCVYCGLEAKYFAKERDWKSLRWHFNLYGIDKYGKEVLFTKDHIIPKSKGGKDDISNYQTMCSKCNEEKGNNMEGD